MHKKEIKLPRARIGKELKIIEIQRLDKAKSIIGGVAIQSHAFFDFTIRRGGHVAILAFQKIDRHVENRSLLTTLVSIVHARTNLMVKRRRDDIQILIER